MTLFFQGKKDLALGVLVSDSFTDVNGVLIVNHAPEIDVVGGGYISTHLNDTPDDNESIIDSNQAKINANNHGFVIETNKNNVNVKVIWNLAAGAANRNSIILRETTANNCWICNFRRIDGVADDFQIGSYEAGSFTQRAVKSYIFADGGQYTIEGRCVGTRIEAIINEGEDSIFYDAATFNLDATKHGLSRNTGYPLTLLDDLLIEEAV